MKSTLIKLLLPALLLISGGGIGYVAGSKNASKNLQKSPVSSDEISLPESPGPGATLIPSSPARPDLEAGKKDVSVGGLTQDAGRYQDKVITVVGVVIYIPPEKAYYLQGEQSRVVVLDTATLKRDLGEFVGQPVNVKGKVVNVKTATGKDTLGIQVESINR